jgi:oxygen-dependent protoporphyrinogen oxidase
MVLPSGVNKATGLSAALQELGLSHHNVIAAGDAENDHALMELCECRVAVANALPSLKHHCDYVTTESHGAGVAEIVEKLVESLSSQGVDLRLNTRVTSIQSLTPDAWNLTLGTGETLTAGAIILATPAYVSAQLLETIDPSLASALKAIPYASTATVTLAYRQSDLPQPLDGYGYVIPRREGRRALACTWTSTKFPHRAPEGYALILVFVGRAGDAPFMPPFSSQAASESKVEGELLALAREELQLTLGIHAEPLVTRVFIWEKAMPQYNLGHPALLQRIDTALEQYPGLVLAGNGYRGIGIPDCIHSGELAVKKIFDNSIFIKL